MPYKLKSFLISISNVVHVSIYAHFMLKFKIQNLENQTEKKNTNIIIKVLLLKSWILEER